MAEFPGYIPLRYIFACKIFTMGVLLIPLICSGVQQAHFVVVLLYS